MKDQPVGDALRDALRSFNERFKGYKDGGYEHSEALIRFWRRLPRDEQRVLEDILLEEISNRTRTGGIGISVLGAVGGERIIAELYKELHLCKVEDDWKGELVGTLLQMGQVTPQLKRTVIKDAQDFAPFGLTNLFLLADIDRDILDLLPELIVEKLRRGDTMYALSCATSLVDDCSDKSPQLLVRIHERIRDIDPNSGREFLRMVEEHLEQPLVRDELGDEKIEMIRERLQQYEE
ncbi:hypothetical protein MRY87_01675 [bacterium]|nr:hypothetical protein [bacterium]